MRHSCYSLFHQLGPPTAHNRDHLILFDNCVVVVAPGLDGIENLGWCLCREAPKNLLRYDMPRNGYAYLINLYSL
jgi:hypothetical protein